VYEREHYPVDFPNPIEAIKFRLEQKGKDTRALIGVVAGRTRVYEVKRAKRPLSLIMIRCLHEKSTYRRLNVYAHVLAEHMEQFEGQRARILGTYRAPTT
jgi:HTH-type transcriptional regulator/antitoxin HigA